MLEQSSSQKNFTAEHHTTIPCYLRDKPLRKIGAGTCGTVLSQDDSHTVYKLERNPGGSRLLQLFNDLKMHYLVRSRLEALQISHQSLDIRIRVPDVYAWIPRAHSAFWEENKFYITAAGAGSSANLPCNILCTERIPPFSGSVTASLIAKFCPAHLREAAYKDVANRDCLVRVYLGRYHEHGEERTDHRYFSLRNFPMSLNRMLEINADMFGFTKTIAETLAALHWAAQVDARDVEFVLGFTRDVAPPSLMDSSVTSCSISLEELEQVSEHTFLGCEETLGLNWHWHKTQLWLLDFNQCSKIPMNEEGVEMAVSAWLDNDPYFPRPNRDRGVRQELWLLFRRRYLEVSQAILGKDSDFSPLPDFFLKGIAMAWSDRTKRKEQALRKSGDSTLR